MDRRLPLGLAAFAVMATPATALAQTWPAGAVATTGYGAIAHPLPLNTLLDAPVWRAPSPAVVAGWVPPNTTAPAPKTPTFEPLAQAPEVNVPAKPLWTDDQGLRLHYAEVIYKQRF